MKLSVIGTGYVGLVAGACFADTGNEVTCLDIDASKIDALKQGRIPIYEPGLDVLVERGVKQGRLKFTTSYEDAIPGREVIFMAVGTPPLPNWEPNLEYIRAASEAVARHMTGPLIVVNKSTVPIGTHASVASWMKPLTQHPIEIVSNPEFLKEGSAIEDFQKPDRILVGTNSDQAFNRISELYAPFVKQESPIVRMDPVSAEITKYACNAYLATRISFMNELSLLCDAVHGDIELVRKGMSGDVRIGKHFLYAGVGYGGSCFPKDVRALAGTGSKHDAPLRIVTATEEANLAQKRVLAERVMRHFGGDVRDRTVGIWGLSYKPNTDDMREAPSITIVNALLSAGARVRAFDPVATETARRVFENRIEYCENALDAATGADALLLVTEWNEFKHPDWSRIKAAMKSPVLFDGRNIYQPQAMRNQGFTYFGIGRG